MITTLRETHRRDAALLEQIEEHAGRTFALRDARAAAQVSSADVRRLLRSGWLRRVGRGHFTIASRPMVASDDRLRLATALRAPRRRRHRGLGRIEGRLYDNALAETVNGLYKAELSHRRIRWRTVEEVELATADWVSFWNFRRLHSATDYLPPAEYERAYFRQQAEPIVAA